MDSNGDKIPDEVKLLVNRIKQQGKEGLQTALLIMRQWSINMKIRSVVYILLYNRSTSLEKKTPQTLRRRRIPDEDMEEFRSIFQRIISIK